jgi:hypothetical protein
VPRTGQPKRRRSDARPAAIHGRLSRLPVGDAAAAPARLLPRDRRRLRSYRHQHRTCPRPPQAPALIRAVTQGTAPDERPGYFLSSAVRRCLTTWPSAPIAEELYYRAGLGRADIDVAQL